MTHSIDVHIGFVIRARRVALGVSQAELAQRIGCSLRQIRKYEHDIDRMSATTLFVLAKTLAMPVTEFFAAIRCAGRS